jgi:hypothetical protein
MISVLVLPSAVRRVTYSVGVAVSADQFQQQLVQLGDHPGVVLAEESAPVDK